MPDREQDDRPAALIILKLRKQCAMFCLKCFRIPLFFLIKVKDKNIEGHGARQGHHNNGEVVTYLDTNYICIPVNCSNVHERKECQIKVALGQKSNGSIPIQVRVALSLEYPD